MSIVQSFVIMVPEKVNIYVNGRRQIYRKEEFRHAGPFGYACSYTLSWSGEKLWNFYDHADDAQFRSISESEAVLLCAFGSFF